MSQLASQLQAMMAKAYRERMAIQRLQLSRGLTIRVYVDDDQSIHLMISRPETYPSIAEWKAVLMALPKVFDQSPDPEQVWGKKTRALTAIIPTVRPDPFNQLAQASQSERTQP